MSDSGPAVLEHPGPWPTPLEGADVGKPNPRYEIDPETGCWLWLGALSDTGYGSLKVKGRTLSAHRYMYELLVGPIPEGLELDHLCRILRCVNPVHLEPVTHAENVRRGSKATKTHCKHGHEFTPENTYTRTDGRGVRQCRACKRRRDRERRARA